MAASVSGILLPSSQRTPLGAVLQAGHHLEWPRLAPMAMHTQRTYALVFCLKGTAEFESERGGRRTFGRGDLMLAFPGRPYRYNHTGAEPWSEFWAVFDGPVFDLWQKGGLLDPASPLVHLEPVGYWHKRLLAVVEPRAGAESERALRRVCLMQDFLSDAIAYDRQSRIAPDERTWLAEVSRLIDPAAIPGPPDWAAVSEALGMSYDAFRKRFARLAGMPPAQFRKARVMERAAQLLLEPGSSLADVAADCGFYDAFHFSRQFKKSMGVSPSEFRRRAAPRS